MKLRVINFILTLTAVLLSARSASAQAGIEPGVEGIFPDGPGYPVESTAQPVQPLRLMLATLKAEKNELSRRMDQHRAQLTEVKEALAAIDIQSTEGPLRVELLKQKAAALQALLGADGELLEINRQARELLAQVIDTAETDDRQELIAAVAGFLGAVAVLGGGAGVGYYRYQHRTVPVSFRAVLGAGVMLVIAALAVICTESEQDIAGRIIKENRNLWKSTNDPEAVTEYVRRLAAGFHAANRGATSGIYMRARQFCAKADTYFGELPEFEPTAK